MLLVVTVQHTAQAVSYMLHRQLVTCINASTFWGNPREINEATMQNIFFGWNGACLARWEIPIEQTGSIGQSQW